MKILDYLCVCFFTCVSIELTFCFDHLFDLIAPLVTSHNWPPFCNYYIKRNYVYIDRTKGSDQIEEKNDDFAR